MAARRGRAAPGRSGRLPGRLHRRASGVPRGRPRLRDCGNPRRRLLAALPKPRTGRSDWHRQRDGNPLRSNRAAAARDLSTGAYAARAPPEALPLRGRRGPSRATGPRTRPLASLGSPALRVVSGRPRLLSLGEERPRPAARSAHRLRTGFAPQAEQIESPAEGPRSASTTGAQRRIWSTQLAETRP